MAFGSIEVKHYLKALCTSSDDVHRNFLLNEVKSGNPTILSQMKDVMRFIKWKQASNPGNILSRDMPLLNDGMSNEELFELSKKTCHYSKRLIDGFTEFIWQENLQHQLQLEGWPHIPKVSLAPLPLPHGTNQEMKVLVMSLFYINNLFNSFLFRFDRTRW